MPLAGNGVADELEELCRVGDCRNINNWLNKLYLFRQEYQIQKREINNSYENHEHDIKNL
jgi:hypothetical protein